MALAAGSCHLKVLDVRLSPLLVRAGLHQTKSKYLLVFGAKIIYKNLAGFNFIRQWRNMHCLIVRGH